MDHLVKMKISINAKPAEVWNALTNPEKTKQYFFGCKVSSGWKAGSPITFKGRIFFIKKIELKGRILKIKPEKFLKYTLGNRGSDSFSTVTDKLTYKNGKTTVTITDDVGKSEGVEKRYKRSVKGWKKVLKGLKELVEKGR
jgi:uncharacterized protein YndB with AHSA1/START domain